MPEPLSPAVRAELDVTPAWWDSQYQAIIRKHIPRDAASHEGHRIAADSYMTYGSIVPHELHWCTTCGVKIEGAIDA